MTRFEPRSRVQNHGVAAQLAEISREDLRQRIESGARFVLVDAMSPISFAASHLPGAVNISPHFVDGRAASRIPDLQTEVVVYCANPNCESSIEVAQRLIELGYVNVLHFAGGKREWEDAGLPLEGGRVSRQEA
jgi:rhodanese-related sulfurtransferase